MLKKSISILVFLLLGVTSAFAVDVDVMVRNQRFQNDTFFFDIYLQRSGAENIFLGNSDFMLHFEETNFSNPELFYQSGSTELYNAYGNPTSFYDTNIGTRHDVDGLHAHHLMVFVQMPTYSNATQFLDRLARIDGQELTHKLGTFYVTGATALNTNPSLEWITSGEGLIVKINHRDSVSMTKEAAHVNHINPALDAEPSVQTSNLAIVTKTSSSISLSWTVGNGATRMVLAKKSSSVNAFPADGLTYTANAVFGDGDEVDTSDVFVVYQGTGTAVTVTGLDPNTTYHFAAFEVNGANGWSENYLTSGADTVSQTTEGLYITANIKVFLQGPYNTATNLMNTHLRMGNSFGTTNLLPAAQPYSAAPWNYSGTENVDTANHPADAVDWILVELRSTYNGSPVTNGRAAGFLLSDGSIVDTNGVDPIRFWNVNSGYYYIVIKHRNHLPVMSKDSILVDANSNMYDFTNGGQGMAYGTDTSDIKKMPLSVLESGVWGMRGGDAGGTVAYQVRYNGGGLNDRFSLLTFVGASSNAVPKNNEYTRTDVNLDRQARYNGGGLNDRFRILTWVGTTTNAVPLNCAVPNP